MKSILFLVLFIPLAASAQLTGSTAAITLTAKSCTTQVNIIAPTQYEGDVAIGGGVTLSYDVYRYQPGIDGVDIFGRRQYVKIFNKTATTVLDCATVPAGTLWRVYTCANSGINAAIVCSTQPDNFIKGGAQ